MKRENVRAGDNTPRRPDVIHSIERRRSASTSDAARLDTSRASRRVRSSARLVATMRVRYSRASAADEESAKERQKKLYRYAVKQEEKQRVTRKTRRVERREAEAAPAPTPADSSSPGR